MTVDYNWFDELDSDSADNGNSLDAYIDISAGGIVINADQMSSANFDGAITKADPASIGATSIKRGDLVFWNLSTNTPITSVADTTADDSEGTSDIYDNNVYSVLDIEYSQDSAEVAETPTYVYLYLDVDGESTRVRMDGGGVIAAIRENKSLSDWDAGTEGWMLTSAGNAIFTNVLVRGTVDASNIIGSTITGTTFKTLDSSGNDATVIPSKGTIIFKGTDASTGVAGNLYVSIDTSDSDISSAGDTAGFNIHTISNLGRLSMDSNEMQASVNNIAGPFTINPFGGNVNIGTASPLAYMPTVTIGNSAGGAVLKIWGTTTTPSADGQSIQASGDIATTGDMYANQFRGTGTGSKDEVIFGFQSDSGFNTGLFYIGENNFGISAGGTKQIDFSTTGTTFVTPTTFNGATNTFTDYTYFNSNTYFQSTGTHRINGPLIINGSLASVDIHDRDVYDVSTDARVVYVSNSSPYYVGTAASTIRLKQQVSLAEEEILNSRFLELEPVRFKYNKAVEEYGENAPYHFGFIAEKAEELGLRYLYGVDDGGIPDYFAHERMPIYLFTFMKAQQKKINELEERLAILEG